MPLPAKSAAACWKNCTPSRPASFGTASDHSALPPLPSRNSEMAGSTCSWQPGMPSAVRSTALR